MGRDVLQIALDGTRRVTPLLQTTFDERNGIVSPDGRWLAYESDSSGVFEIYVRPFPNDHPDVSGMYTNRWRYGHCSVGARSHGQNVNT